MNYIYSEDEIYERVKKLNTLQERMCEWRKVKARKEHVDEFGVNIPKNEYYYKKELGSIYEVLKLSRKSMDTFLYVLFNGNYRLQSITGKIAEEKELEFARKMDELFPGNEENE